MQLSRRLGICAMGWLVLALAGCASGPKISSEVDPEADFGSYRTFGFYLPLALEKEGYATPTTDRIKAAARAQMESRGYAFTTDRPDLWVNLNAYLQEKTDVSTIPTVDYNYYYSYRARSYFAVPYWRDQTSVRQYTEGTLNVDLVDRAKNRLVWEGIAVGRVSKAKPEERGARIDSAVAEIFARFPYRASASTP